jgi:hypothetical protein
MCWAHTLRCSYHGWGNEKMSSKLLVLQVAVITKFPQLVDLQGPARINQTDVAAIMGFTGECCCYFWFKLGGHHLSRM